MWATCKIGVLRVLFITFTSPTLSLCGVPSKHRTPLENLKTVPGRCHPEAGASLRFLCDAISVSSVLFHIKVQDLLLGPTNLRDLHHTACWLHSTGIMGVLGYNIAGFGPDRHGGQQPMGDVLEGTGVTTHKSKGG